MFAGLFLLHPPGIEKENKLSNENKVEHCRRRRTAKSQSRLSRAQQMAQRVSFSRLRHNNKAIECKICAIIHRRGEGYWVYVSLLIAFYAELSRGFITSCKDCLAGKHPQHKRRSFPLPHPIVSVSLCSRNSRRDFDTPTVAWGSHFDGSACEREKMCHDSA